MQLCSEDHQEICFKDGIPCPLCDSIQEKKEMEETAEDLRTKINDLKDVIDEKERETEQMVKRIEQLEKQMDDVTHL
jgi:uncharacterized protein Yka (UPF0111/DUF47 family)